MDNERSIERYFVTQVRAAGGWPVKLSCPGTAGMPDRMVLWPAGRCHFIELKAKGKRPRPLQVDRMERLNHFGFWTSWFSSRDEIDLYVAYYREVYDKKRGGAK